MLKTLKIWILIALLMGVLMSFSIISELQAAEMPMGKGLLPAPVSEPDLLKCKQPKPYWDDNKCVECIYTLDCTGNRICDGNECLCPGKQTFDDDLGDCACDEQKYPSGEHVDEIKCTCEKGYEQFPKETGGFECLTPEQIQIRIQIQSNALPEQKGMSD